MRSSSEAGMTEHEAQWSEESIERYTKRQEAAALKRRGEPPPALPIEPAECGALVESLKDGTADWFDVQRRLIVTLGGGRVWRTKAWAELRERLIQKQCGQCGASEGPFTLHHLTQSVTLTDFVREIRNRVFQGFRAELGESEAFQAIGGRFVPDGGPRPGCEYCGGTNLRERMRNRRAHAGKSRFVCETMRAGKVCKREFEEPVLLQPIRLQTPASQRYHLIQQRFAEYYASIEEDIYRSASILAIRQFARYMAGIDTTTFCKRCAYLWDVKAMRLCQQCRNGWHAHERQHCNACELDTQYVVCRSCRKVRHPATFDTCYKCAFGLTREGAITSVASDLR